MMDKSTWNFVLIFTAMIATVLVLTGCTRFATRTGQEKEWDVRMTTETCEVRVQVRADDEITDDSIDVSRGGAR